MTLTNEQKPPHYLEYGKEYPKLLNLFHEALIEVKGKTHLLGASVIVNPYQVIDLFNQAQTEAEAKGVDKTITAIVKVLGRKTSVPVIASIVDDVRELLSPHHTTGEGKE